MVEGREIGEAEKMTTRPKAPPKGWTRYKIVEVEWVDCYTSGDWEDNWVRKVKKWVKEPPIVAYTYGILMYQDKKCVVVAGTWALDLDTIVPSSSMNDLTYIPATMLNKVRVLGYKNFPLDIDGEEG